MNWEYILQALPRFVDASIDTSSRFLGYRVIASYRLVLCGNYGL